jgi:hypothetical protein
VVSRYGEKPRPDRGPGVGTRVALREGERGAAESRRRHATQTTTEVTSMNKRTWLQVVLAAILVVLAGAIIAAAEEGRIEVRVEQEGPDEISVDVNGVTEVVRLDDLADGESRTVDVGDHEIVVRRVGDELKLTDEGYEFGMHGGDLETMVWLTDDGDRIEIDGGQPDDSGQRVMVMKVTGDGDEGGETQTYRIEVEGDRILLNGAPIVDVDEVIMRNKGEFPHGVLIGEGEDGEHVKVFRSVVKGGDLVTYRCEETGSVLMVKRDDAIEDAYICPATGCVMTRVEEPDVHVVTVTKKVEVEDEE